VCSDDADNDCDSLTDAQDPGCSTAVTDGVTAGHGAAAGFDAVPAVYITQARNRFRIAYGHTSHGSQVVTGMSMLQSESDVYRYNSDGTGGALSLHDRMPSGDLGNPDRTTWAERTRELLDEAGNDRNMIMWSWCGQVSDAGEGDIDTYLSLMNQLEADYPEVTFIYMTGHLDGSGAQGNLKVRNDQIRAYCQANNKVLFDFADIESWDPAGNNYPDETDECGWCSTWCGSHSCPGCEHCSHSHCYNCYLKGKAFWWLLARLAGWEGN